VTGEPIEKRDDDREAVVRDRLRVHHEHAPGLEDFYRNRGQLVIVNGDQAIDRVADEIDRLIAVQVVA
jgi:adenylate kinase